MTAKQDKIWMQRALSLAEKGRGYVSPNPMVGCVIVSEEGDVIGEGYHERYGKAHAEVNAMNQVDDADNLKNATVYVTLEPCSHHGKTPPCAQMLADKPIKRVVVAMKDPSEKVNGRGLELLRNEGIDVDTGILQKEAKELNECWLHYIEFNRPFITLKIAQTADGYIAAPNGDSKWISSKESREKVHIWRSQNDAVMVGRNTALHDNPSLTVRLVEGRQPKRVVIDGPFELPRNLNLFSDQFEEKTIVITHNRKKSKDEADPMLKMLQSNYFRGEIIHVEKVNGHSRLKEGMRKLADHGITSLLVEGGQQLSSALLKRGLVDRLQLFIAPKLLGGGTKSIVNLDINRMEDIVPFRDHNWQQTGQDILLTANL
ncbi:bifunctional diaminohydroxyphosphoribosylaminopyrimidine deaminase/5-amino-6-(5-phosphoribosylamino)uracil reductase RibD [Rhodohalobacter sulfatireducens]|uniref:Riboflavin biosynthesis protein RibD n=1 Tax=Rhodohalobacter sulfatireducens TaxID=2911366 RepID=A0ABS9KAJ0_9BACT|nr:bifunctional diaminohydroxyphosphoribosylaminopyrimidine deaminase/5-amino-6-(5-phosphoribosylamino)uracil reductase RibD [Rhodohalobacter sulfatireducens]MDR9365465.1 bifunctional diaminohydroxyphosphoribosylaminopyrimidine deaminase/5-amino-6-(5-phosphoribosylamino)uracil reductase RibD [Balneolaceae bacterium]MDR9408815.1 bifunctional diaminohydroxyphosphoribosylaminopyrimidine deaminase/5-amino-6-(5-phosphoribosylamino)uracil reductase RibD [Balneolaceae bacterium]